MNEQVREREAKQGRGGKRVLLVMIASLALMAIAWVIYEAASGGDPIDKQAVAPTGDADVVTTTQGDVIVPENTPVTEDAEVVTVPKQQTPALATGAEMTAPANESEPVVVPEPQGN